MYNNLKFEMKKRKVSNRDLMEALKLSYQSISNKICGRTSFKIEEAVEIRDLFFPFMALEYLFEKTN